jgi:hypothetical protein
MKHSLFALSTFALALLGLQPAMSKEQAAPMTHQQKIANAMSAAPAEISRNATIKDWPTKEGGELRVLRQGSNDWVCLPDDPSTSGNDPMCLDREWQQWAQAYMAKTKPQIQQAGIAYMLNTNAEVSNTDPYATGPTPHNQWHKIGPHIMLLMPDPTQLEGISSNPHSGGPYVMFKDTPYAHVMMPVQ